MKLKRILPLFISTAVIISSMGIKSVMADENRLTAFPNAEGGGMYTQGARAAENIDIYHVTNLNDSGDGSFRDAVSQGNRIIVFDVAGNIMLGSDIVVRASNLTILGQTAPGEGICIGGESVRFNGCENVILRYVRFRMGDNSVSQEDGLGVRKCTSFIIDHCSVEWSVDECLSAYENKDFTAQYCIISESLNNSGHDKGSHGYGGIWGGINASFHHNLISSHSARMPRIGSSATVSTYNGRPDTDSLIDIRNNVFYNYRSTIGYGGENGTRVNFVNNFYRPSQYSSKNVNFYTSYVGSKGGTTLHLSGNYIEGDDVFNSDNWYSMGTPSNWTKCESISDGIVVDGVLKRNDEYIYDYPVTTGTALEAYDTVIEAAGDSLVRDYTDTRIVNDVINSTTPQGSNGSEGLIDSQEDVDGWNGLYGTKEQDSDSDGIPDYWEDANGLNKYGSYDGASISPTGYTNIEDYANDIVLKTYNSVDKLEMWSLMNYTAKLDKSVYLEDTWTPVSNSFEAAKIVLGNRNATEEQIDRAYNDLSFALDGLMRDKTSDLKAAIAAAEKVEKNDYTNESYNSLLFFVEQGKQILDSDYDESLVVSCTQKINDAAENLEISNRVGLNRTIERYAEYENDDWTADSYNMFVNAINNAVAIYSDYFADEASYAGAEEDIKSAYEALEPIYDAEKEVLNFEDMEIGQEINSMDKGIFSLSNNGTSQKFFIISDNDGKVCRIPSKSWDMSIKTNQSFDRQAIYSFESDFKFTSDAAGTGFTVMSVGGVAFLTKKGNSSELEIFVSGESEPRIIGSIYPNRWNNIRIIVNNEKHLLDVYLNGKAILKGSAYEGGLSYVEFPSQCNIENDLYVDNLSVTKRIYPKVRYLYGDMDCDEIITANDAACVLQKALDETYTMPIEYKTEEWFKYADVGCDGNIAADDAAYILQKVSESAYKMPAESTTELTTESTTELPTLTTTEPTTVMTTQSAESTTGEPVEPQELVFDKLGVNSVASPYSSGVITLTSTNGNTIEFTDMEHNGYLKAIDGDTTDITINAQSKAVTDVYYKSKSGYIYIDDGLYSEPYVGDDIVQTYTVQNGKVVLKNAYIYAICVRSE